MHKIVVSALLATPLFAFAVPGNLVTNGSFESNVLGAGSWEIFSGSQVEGWNAHNEIEIRNGVAGGAEDGSNFVEMDANHNSSMTQKLTTQVGTSYVVSFYYSNRTGDKPRTDGLEFKIGDKAVILPALKVNKTGDNVWTLFTTTFIATSELTNLTFKATGKSDSYGSSLDNVVVTAVPEPEVYAMFLAGLGALGFVAYKRKRDQR
jgi:hypothetical protein